MGQLTLGIDPGAQQSSRFYYSSFDSQFEGAGRAPAPRADQSPRTSVGRAGVTSALSSGGAAAPDPAGQGAAARSRGSAGVQQGTRTHFPAFIRSHGPAA
jgi:hypothetical protein